MNLHQYNYQHLKSHNLVQFIVNAIGSWCIFCWHTFHMIIYYGTMNHPLSHSFQDCMVTSVFILAQSFHEEEFTSKGKWNTLCISHLRIFYWPVHTGKLNMYLILLWDSMYMYYIHKMLHIIFYSWYTFTKHNFTQKFAVSGNSVLPCTQNGKICLLISPRFYSTASEHSLYIQSHFNYHQLFKSHMNICYIYTQHSQCDHQLISWTRQYLQLSWEVSSEETACFLASQG
jgi:hypothetical protein